MSTILKAVGTTVGASLVLAAIYWGLSLAADPPVRKSVITSAYQLRAEAQERFETLAADQEAGRLDNERQLIELELKMLQSKPDRVQADNERIEYLKQRRALIEARLIDANKKS